MQRAPFCECSKGRCSRDKWVYCYRVLLIGWYNGGLGGEKLGAGRYGHHPTPFSSTFLTSRGSSPGMGVVGSEMRTSITLASIGEGL